MEKLVFSVFDSKAKLYGQPYFAINEEVGVRHFAAAVRDPNSLMGRFAGDYTLFCVGTFNEETGVLTVRSEGHLNIINGLALQAALEGGR